MGLRLTKRGNTWYIRGTVRGQQIYESTGTRDKSIAEAIRIKAEKRILDESVYGKSSVVSFRDAAEAYALAGGSLRFVLDVKADGSESGLAVHFGDRLLSSITQADLDDAARILYPTATGETRNRQCYTPFIAIWNHAFSDEPAMARKWRRPRKAKGTNVRAAKSRAGTTSIDYDTAARFVAAMSPDAAMLMTALFYTGLRPIEAFALEAADVDIVASWLVVRASKTGEPRGVPLHPFLCEWLGPLLDRARDDGRPVFRTQRGEPYTEILEGGGGLKTAIKGARRRSGIAGISPYTARHTVSTGLVVAGVHPHIKDQILGHAADDMSRHYTNVPQATMIEAISTLPVPGAWPAIPWVTTPADWFGKLARPVSDPLIESV